MSNVPSPREVSELWEARRKDFVQSRRRIREVRQWLAHQKDPDVPPEFENKLGMRVKLPMPITSSLHTQQVLGRKRPLYKREPLGRGLAPQRKSTRIEQWVNGLLAALERQQGPVWKPLIGALFNQGECAAMLYPALAHWESFPDFLGEDGKPKPTYQRDGKGRDPQDEYYARDKRRAFQMDGEATRAAYTDFHQHWRAQRVPIVARVVPAEQCLPILGPGLRLDGLLIRSVYTEETLTLQGYSWYGPEGTHPGPGHSEDSSSLSRTCTLTELWLPGSVTYYVGAPQASGRDQLYTETRRKNARGDEDTNTIDLADEFGLNRLLATYVYGAHFAEEEDPDQRGVPFLWPFLPSYAGANSIASSQVGYMWRYAFEGPMIEPDPNLPASMFMENGAPRRIKLDAMTATVAPGKVSHSLHPGTGPDVGQIMSLLLGATEKESPDRGALGGSGPTSGHDRTIERAHLEDTMSMVLGDSQDYSGALGAWRWLGETALEVGSRIAERKGHAVAVATSVNQDRGTRREHNELGADVCDDVWDLEAYYPTQPGENLPLFAQLLQAWKEGATSFREMREMGMGDASPEQTLAEIQAEKFLTQTDMGQQLLMEMVAEELGDEKMAEALKLQQSGRMLGDGTPAGMLQGVGGGMLGQQSQGAPIPGTQPGIPGQAALNGIVAGGMGTQSLVRDAAATAGSGIGGMG